MTQSARRRRTQLLDPKLDLAFSRLFGAEQNSRNPKPSPAQPVHAPRPKGAPPPRIAVAGVHDHGDVIAALRSGFSDCVLARVGAWGRADETPEVPIQLALIVEPDDGRDLARLDASREQLLRAHDAQSGEIGVRW